MASAPAATAASTSCSRVKPQILMRVRWAGMTVEGSEFVAKVVIVRHLSALQAWLAKLRQPVKSGGLLGQSPVVGVNGSKKIQSIG